MNWVVDLNYLKIMITGTKDLNNSHIIYLERNNSLFREELCILEQHIASVEHPANDRQSLNNLPLEGYRTVNCLFICYFMNNVG